MRALVRWALPLLLTPVLLGVGGNESCGSLGRTVKRSLDHPVWDVRSARVPFSAQLSPGERARFRLLITVEPRAWSPGHQDGPAFLNLALEDPRQGASLEGTFQWSGDAQRPTGFSSLTQLHLPRECHAGCEQELLLELGLRPGKSAPAPVKLSAWVAIGGPRVEVSVPRPLDAVRLRVEPR